MSQRKTRGCGHSALNPRAFLVFSSPLEQTLPSVIRAPEALVTEPHHLAS